MKAARQNLPSSEIEIVFLNSVSALKQKDEIIPNKWIFAYLTVKTSTAWTGFEKCKFDIHSDASCLILFDDNSKF